MPVEALERLHRDAEPASRLLGRRRGRDAAQPELPARERVQQVSDSGARPEPDGGAVLDKRGRGLGGGPLLVLYVRSGQRAGL